MIFEKKKNQEDDFGRNAAKLVSDYVCHEGLLTFLFERGTRVDQF